MAKYGKRPPKKGKKLTEKIGLSGEETAEKTRSVVGSLALGALALFIASAAYFISKFFLFPDVVIWAREVLSLILALLIAAGFGSVFKGEDNKISGSVVIFIFAIFIWQIVDGYSDYDFSRDGEKVSRATSTEISARTVYPRSDPYVFQLERVGDSTPWIVFPKGGLYDYFFTSHNYGFKVVFSNGDQYEVHENLWIPDRKQPQLKLVATKPNQFIQFTVKNRN